MNEVGKTENQFRFNFIPVLLFCTGEKQPDVKIYLQKSHIYQSIC